ncbi:MAG: hypothetical protein ACHP6H_01850 [Legionellales bacterium]
MKLWYFILTNGLDAYTDIALTGLIGLAMAAVRTQIGLYFV